MKFLLTLGVLFCFAFVSAQDLIPYRSGKQWGYADRSGRIIIAPQYEAASLFEEGVAIVSKEGRMALINASNEPVIPFAQQMLGTIYKGTCLKIIPSGSKGIYGAVSLKNETLVPCIYDFAGRQGDFFMVTKGYLNGVYSLDGKMLLDTVYTYIHYTDGFFRVSKDPRQNVQGLISREGKLVTPMEYMVFDRFSGGRAKARKGDLFGYIDSSGKEVIPPMYDLAWTFSEGHAVVESKKNGVWAYGMIDRNGKPTIPVSFQKLNDLHGGVALGRKNNGWGLVTANGKTIIGFEYDTAVRGYETAIACKRSGKWSLFNRDGKRKTGFEYDSVAVIENDERSVRDFGLKRFAYDPGYLLLFKNGRQGLCNSEGKVVVPPVYDDIYPFNNGVALVKKEGKWAMISSGGKLITAFKYDQFIPYQAGANSWKNHGVITYLLNGKAGLINRKGEELTEAKYERTQPDDSGYTAVVINRKYGLLDPQGKEIIPVKYDRIRAGTTRDAGVDAFIVNGLILVQKAGKYGYVLENGTELFQ
jgi:hypothetical protein